MKSHLHDEKGVLKSDVNKSILSLLDEIKTTGSGVVFGGAFKGTQEGQIEISQFVNTITNMNITLLLSFLSTVAMDVMTEHFKDKERVKQEVKTWFISMMKTIDRIDYE